MISIFLLRHGEAGPHPVSDAARSLTAAGRQVIESVAEALPDVDLMAVSPYVRAIETADIVAGHISINSRIQTDTLVPEAPVSDVASWLQSSDAGSILLVTHNPLVSRLASWLTGEDDIRFAPGTLVRLEGDIVGPGCFTLVWQK